MVTGELKCISLEGLVTAKESVSWPLTQSALAKEYNSAVKEPEDGCEKFRYHSDHVVSRQNASIHQKSGQDVSNFPQHCGYPIEQVEIVHGHLH